MQLEAPARATLESPFHGGEKVVFYNTRTVRGSVLCTAVPRTAVPLVINDNPPLISDHTVTTSDTIRPVLSESFTDIVEYPNEKLEFFSVLSQLSTFL
ncbi:hypothetical protein J6590_047089 [Homalodisca vitripennis]|nr:hypothetical protein J6590_047089 [Homalodisca vitripennis]